jgi:hypothetical protein
LPITQVNVFLDNRPGSLFEVMNQLDRNKITVFAMTIADAGECGLVRLIAEDPEKASKVFEEADFNLAKSKKNTEVSAILVSKDNQLSKVTKLLCDAGINIDYAYSSAVHVEGKVAVILRPGDIEKAEQLFKENSIEVLSLGQIKQYFR